MKVFYHSADLDGHCSGAIIKTKYPDCELIGINYGDIFPWSNIKKNENVFMVDFALQPFSDMEKLNKIAKLSWIDHHKTAIEEAHKKGFIASKLQVLQIGKAACELCWETFYPGVKNRTVELLGRYDVWDLIPNTLELQNGLRMYDTLPNNDFLWKKLLGQNNAFLDDVLKIGSTLLRKQKMDNIAYIKACSFETEIDGLNVIALNRGLTNSKIFESEYNPKKHDAMLTFVWRKGQWTVSLYSDQKNIDVSKICKARGGGGHKGAAGFQCSILPFLLK